MKKIRNKIQEEKGITLIALVITIIVLIILAGVSINLVLGENGIIKKAQYAKSEYEKGAINDLIMLNQMVDYMDGLEGSKSEKVDLSNKLSLWYGDSIMVGLHNTRKVTNSYGVEVPAGIPDYYRDLAGSNVTKTLNFAVAGTTISNNSPNDLHIEKVISLTSLGEEANNVELVVLDGGGNDILAYEAGAYDSSLMKNIGTATDTTSDTVINDFRKIIKLIKEKFPNAKILYVHPLSLDQTAIEMQTLKNYGVYDHTVEEINEEYHTDFKTMKDVRLALLRAPEYATTQQEARSMANRMLARAEGLYRELPIVCKELGVEYLDLSSIIEQNRDESDNNSYVNDTDKLHITHEGYTELAPHIERKVREMFEKK